MNDEVTKTVARALQRFIPGRRFDANDVRVLLREFAGAFTELGINLHESTGAFTFTSEGVQGVSDARPTDWQVAVRHVEDRAVVQVEVKVGPVQVSRDLELNELWLDPGTARLYAQPDYGDDEAVSALTELSEVFDGALNDAQGELADKAIKTLTKAHREYLDDHDVSLRHDSDGSGHYIVIDGIGVVSDAPRALQNDYFMGVRLWRRKEK